MTAHNAEGEGVTPLSVEDAIGALNVSVNALQRKATQETMARIGRARNALIAAVRAENASRLAEVEQELTTLRTAAALARDLLRPVPVTSVRQRVMSGDELGELMLERSIAEAKAFEALDALLPATSTGDRPVPESEGAQG